MSQMEIVEFIGKQIIKQIMDGCLEFDISLRDVSFLNIQKKINPTKRFLNMG